MENVINEFNQKSPVASKTVSGINTDDVAFDDMKARLVNSVKNFDGLVANIIWSFYFINFQRPFIHFVEMCGS